MTDVTGGTFVGHGPIFRQETIEERIQRLLALQAEKDAKMEAERDSFREMMMAKAPVTKVPKKVVTIEGGEVKIAPEFLTWMQRVEFIIRQSNMGGSLMSPAIDVIPIDGGYRVDIRHPYDLDNLIESVTFIGEQAKESAEHYAKAAVKREV